MRDYRVACATYNGKLVAGQAQSVPGDSSEHLSAWLAPSLAQDRIDDDDDAGPDERSERQPAPDFVAVGFQEMIPLVCSVPAVLGGPAPERERERERK